MSHYVDGFVLPVARDSLENYKQMVEKVAEVWKEHGALEYHEYVGDDMHLEGTLSFLDLAAASDDEVIVFGWVVFESREARDLANQQVAADPRMAGIMDGNNTSFDAMRMAYGGFLPLV